MQGSNSGKCKSGCNYWTGSPAIVTECQFHFNFVPI